MVATTFSKFGGSTEAAEVAQAFASQVVGKTILITGVNLKGVGYTTAEAFASQAPKHLILAGRTPSKLQESIDALRALYPSVDYRMLVVDLGSQASVRAAAATALAWDDVPTIDIIINNAGIMMLPERTINEDGVEMHFATNHLGHFLLTNLLRSKLLAAAARPGVPKGAVRVVNVSAGVFGAPVSMRWSDPNFETLNRDLPAEEQPFYPVHEMFGFKDTQNKAYVPVEGYAQSKIANVLFAVGLTDKLYAKYGIRGLAVHPGVIMTELVRNHDDATRSHIMEQIGDGTIQTKSAKAGASTSVVAALDPKLGEDVGIRPSKSGPSGGIHFLSSLAASEVSDNTENYGTVLADCQISKAGPKVISSSEAAKLWKRSEELVGESFSW